MPWRGCYGPARHQIDQGGAFLSAVASVVDADTYEEAARIHNECRSAGIAGSAVDFLICAVALRRNWEVFTLDKDFERYARKVPLALFVPRRFKH